MILGISLTDFHLEHKSWESLFSLQLEVALKTFQDAYDKQTVFFWLFRSRYLWGKIIALQKEKSLFPQLQTAISGLKINGLLLTEHCPPI